MKTRLLLLFSLITCLGFGQAPTDYTKFYNFTNGSLINMANPGTYDITVTGANNYVTTADRDGNVSNALNITAAELNTGAYSGNPQEFSYSFWVKTTTTDNAFRTVFRQQDNNTNSSGGGVRAFLRNGRIRAEFAVSAPLGGSGYTEVFSNPVADGSWHNVIITVALGTNGSGQSTHELKIYTDGILNDSATIGASTPPTLFTSSKELILTDATNDSNTAPYIGEFDDVKVWTRPLSAVEVASINNVVPTDDIRRYLFSGSLLDASASARHLSVRNGENAFNYTNDPVATSNSAIQMTQASFSGGLIDPNVSLNDFSISFWIKTNVILPGNQQQEIMSLLSDPNGQAIRGLFLLQGANNLQLIVDPAECNTNGANCNSNLSSLIVASSVIADNLWHHITVSVSASDNMNLDRTFVGNIYVDGSLDATNNRTYFNNPSFPKSVRVNDGALNFYTGRYAGQWFVGDLDDIRVFPRELDPLEVSVLSTNNAPAALTRVYVDVDANGNNDGTSWADAYTDLSIALAANPGAEFWIADGTYIPGASRTSKFTITEDQKIYGGFNGTESMLSQRDPAINVTILSGDLNANDTPNISFSNVTRNENVYNVVFINGSNTVLDGVTVSGGNANGSSTPLREGAGIKVTGNGLSGIEITNCIIKGNTGLRGGAALFGETTGNGNEITVDRTLIRDNLAEFAPIFYNVQNSGVLNITFSNSLLVKNVCGRANGTTASDVAGMWIRTQNSGTTATNIINTTITDNTSVNSPGSSIMIAPTRSQSGSGTFNLQNSIVYNNQGDNNVEFTPVGIVSGFSSQTLTFNNSLHGLGTTGFTGGSGSGNIIGDPLFTNSSTNDYTLQSASPCKDTGDNVYLPANNTLDFNGNARIVNTTVDMGAFEFDPSLSITNFEDEFNEIKLYPNPTTSILNIETTNQQIEQIEIYDMLGKQILKTNQTEINVSNLKTGIYLLKAKTTLGEVIKRFVKQ